MAEEEKNDGTTTVSFRIPVHLRGMLEHIAEMEERTLSQQIIFYLKKGVKEWGREQETKHPSPPR